MKNVWVLIGLSKVPKSCILQNRKLCLFENFWVDFFFQRVFFVFQHSERFLLSSICFKTSDLGVFFSLSWILWKQSWWDATWPHSRQCLWFKPDQKQVSWTQSTQKNSLKDVSSSPYPVTSLQPQSSFWLSSENVVYNRFMVCVCLCVFFF